MRTAKIPVPKANKEYVVTFDSLAGGLNIRDLDVKLPNSETPEMKNLIWKDGALNSRDGQIWIDSTQNGQGFSLHKRIWQSCLIFHAGTNIYAHSLLTHTTTSICSNVPQYRGTFFEYGGYLFYKTKGLYKRIQPSLTVTDVTPFTPVITINASPLNGSGDAYQPENRISAYKTVWYNAVQGRTAYRLPVTPDSVVSCVVDGVYRSDWSYSNGVVTFTTAPPVTNPPTNNTVRITYRKTNSDAYNSIMDCTFAEVYGGAGNLCIVMAGCPSQPNAYFWNGNDNISMNPGYFPMEQYQLAGDNWERVTAFGKQQNYLVVFKEHSVGRTTQSTEDIDGRLYIDMPYISINSGVGCDLPWTVQLVQNNLVWCNSQTGAYILTDSSAALEINLVNISDKVNGSNDVRGLLYALQHTNEDRVTAWNDDGHYMVCAGGKVWLWNYSISSYTSPSWFYFTDVKAVDFAEGAYHLDTLGRLSKFERVFSDYDQPIHKLYRFATQIFGGYDRLKDVKSILVSTRSDTSTRIQITYLSDWEQRRDLTDVVAWTNNLVPRNLTYRDLSGNLFSFVFRRRPKCQHVRHFTMTLENNEVGHDMSIVSAQIFFNYQGRER